MKSTIQPFVASRQGVGAILATIFFTGVFVFVNPQGVRRARTSPSDAGNASMAQTNAHETAREAGADDNRNPASVSRHSLPFQAESSSTALTPQAVKMQTGIDAIRVRSAIFFADTITQHTTSFTLRMNLFPDAMLTAEFQTPSVLNTNSGLYVGTIAGDPDGEFRLNIEGQKVSGTIRAFHKSYQLIPTNGSTHLIAELKSN